MKQIVDGLCLERRIEVGDRQRQLAKVNSDIRVGRRIEANLLVKSILTARGWRVGRVQELAFQRSPVSEES